MQPPRIEKIEPQNIFDLLVQHAGAISGVFEFLKLNGLTDFMLEDGEYFKPEVINEDVAKFLNPSGLATPTVVTGGMILSDFDHNDFNSNDFN